jgi:SAM-dependent methyltransferase
VCASGHRYPVRDGVPILLLDDVEHTHEAALYALRGEERSHAARGPRGIDSFVQEAIGATGGYLYDGLAGRLTDYPIPELRMPPATGQILLDIGCSWGRWSIAASRLGYRVVGIDPSLEGVRAAYRVSQQMDIEACFLVADARYLPFARDSVDAVFSYSVLQHFAKEDVRLALAEIARVLTSDGRSLIQLPNAFGVRSVYHQLRRGFREPRLFEVRYWSVGELRRTFEERIGPSEILVDGFFSLNPQAADLRLLPAYARAVVRASEMLRRLSQPMSVLKYLADSLYIASSARAA